MIGFVSTCSGSDGVNLVVFAVLNCLVAVGAGGENQSIARIVGVVVVNDVGSGYVGVGGDVIGVDYLDLTVSIDIMMEISNRIIGKNLIYLGDI
ncbi:hypothetical protein [Chamaesiphon sp. VAR_69_metabat_338]|uniref:hypothetical protein n=1 Tax=Chamaesiphon sp. VAR_69_metabat_338 TaxID=2964704 RepID=UPI00286E8FCC|nr:hypothetical protein [Chamaesiphon sp. VAR_69_metabat_338]